MSPLEHLAHVSQRLDQAVYRRLGLARLTGKPGSTYVSVVSGILVVALFSTALWRLDHGASQIGSASSGESTSSPGTSSTAEGTSPYGDQTSSAKTGVAGNSSRRSSQTRGGATLAGTSGLVATGRGVTDSTITIGVLANIGLGEVRQALLGQQGNDSGDNRTQAKAAIDYINSRGGVAKRKIVPVYHDMDARQSYDVSAQEACADFTEDHHVFAVVDMDGSGPWAEQLIACLAKRDTLRIGPMETDRKFADDYAPYYYDPSGFTLTRAGPIHVLGLLKQGYFEPGAKIGLIRYDRPSDQRAAEQGIKPALVTHGIKLSDEVAVSYLSRISDISGTAAQTSNAALRFRSNNITHVLIQDRRALALLFLNSAESQHYRPRYGLTSFSQPQVLAPLVSAEQLHRALGVGWLPVTDVHPQRIPPPNASRQVCIDIMKKAGVSNPELDADALSYCDDLFFLKMVGDSGAALTTAAFQASAEGLGTRFESVLTHASRLGPGRHDGANGWRPLAFDDGCGCFQYVGGLEPLA